MSHIIVRPACLKDALEIAQLTLIAGGGIFEFLLEGLIEDMSLENFLASEIQKETGNLSYVHTDVAELNSKIIGTIKSIDAKQEVVTQEMRDFLSPEKLDWLKDLFSSRLKEGLYINSLAINSNYRKQGIGTSLMNHVKNKAKKQQIYSLNLTVWSDNINAIKFYKNQEFIHIKHINIDFHPLMPHHGGMKLMQCLLKDNQ